MPEIAFAGQETVSKYGSNLPPEEAVLDEVAVIFDENVLDQVWITDKKHGPRAETEGNNIAVLTIALRQETKWIAGERYQVTEPRKSFWAASLTPDRSCTCEYRFRRAHGVGSF